MVNRLLVLAIVSCFYLPATLASGQTLKLPNLLPFKKKSNEVKPFELSDRKGSQQKQLFDFLKPKKKSNMQSSNRRNALEDFNMRSKAFLEKTGDDLNAFGQKTRRLFGDAWNPPGAHAAWWNQGPRQKGQDDILKSWLNHQAKLNGNQKTAPTPRSARRFEYGQPKHRFK